MTGRLGVACNRRAQPARPIIMRTYRGVLVVLTLGVAAVLLPGCSTPANGPATTTADTAPSAAPTPHSGIRGVTMVDAGCPMSRQATPCPDRAIAAAITITPATGSPAAATRIASDQQGRFEIALPPGTYQLQAGSLTGAPVPIAAPRTVQVRTDRYTTITVHLDSGIR